VNFPIANNYPDHFFDANWVHTVSASMVNSFTANYGRIRFNNGVSTDPTGIFGLNGNKVVGIPGNPQQTAGFSSQNFNGTGGAGYPSGFGTNPSPEIFIDNVFGYADNFTWQKGRHLLKFGAEFLRYQQNSSTTTERTARHLIRYLRPNRGHSIRLPTSCSIEFRTFKLATSQEEPDSANGATASLLRMTSSSITN
jgi:hypothetical protein